jgi:hypothetical protein
MKAYGDEITLANEITVAGISYEQVSALSVGECLP